MPPSRRRICRRAPIRRFRRFSGMPARASTSYFLERSACARDATSSHPSATLSIQMKAVELVGVLVEAVAPHGERRAHLLDRTLDLRGVPDDLGNAPELRGCHPRAAGAAA